jgi:hypothetical protein
LGQTASFRLFFLAPEHQAAQAVSHEHGGSRATQGAGRCRDDQQYRVQLQMKTQRDCCPQFNQRQSEHAQKALDHSHSSVKDVLTW